MGSCKGEIFNKFLNTMSMETSIQIWWSANRGVRTKRKMRIRGLSRKIPIPPIRHSIKTKGERGLRNEKSNKVGSVSTNTFSLRRMSCLRVNIWAFKEKSSEIGSCRMVKTANATIPLDLFWCTPIYPQPLFYHPLLWVGRPKDKATGHSSSTLRLTPHLRYP